MQRLGNTARVRAKGAARKLARERAGASWDELGRAGGGGPAPEQARLSFWGAGPRVSVLRSTACDSSARHAGHERRRAAH